ncbi:DUF58 domain-containing protein [Peribacillus frigoritolerans]|nr:DUF58 domain-containing protein [Peribacillus frigoritolerans]
MILIECSIRGAVVSTKKTQREHSVVSGVREYQPGDQLSWINWKATARTSEIMTKEFEVQKKPGCIHHA